MPAATPIYDALAEEQRDVLAEAASDTNPDLAETITQTFAEVTASDDRE